MTPGSWFSLIVLGIALVGSKILPASWGRENGLIEWAQVVILGLAILAAMLAAHYGVGPLRRRRLFFWSVPIWFLAMGRELSWGKVLYVAAPGKVIHLADLWYGAYVYPLIAFLILITVWGLLKNGLLSEILNWTRYGTVPLLEILILFGAAMVATVVEHYGFGCSDEELYEELAELVCYSALVFLIIDLGFNKKIQPVCPC